MANWEFPFSDPVDISVDSWASGRIAVSGEPAAGAVSVEVVPSRGGRAEGLDDVEVAFEDGQLYVRGPRWLSFRHRTGLDLGIRVPAGSTCAAKTASAGLSCAGVISAVSLNTASGDLTAEAVAGDVVFKSASGDIRMDTVDGDLTVRTASGNARVRQVGGEARVSSASGDLALGSCGGPVTARTASGDIRLERVVAGLLDLSTASGDIYLQVAPGLGVYLDLSSMSGRVRSDLEETDGGEGRADAGVEIRARTLSGDIHITRAQGRPVTAAAAPAPQPAGQ